MDAWSRGKQKPKKKVDIQVNYSSNVSSKSNEKSSKLDYKRKTMSKESGEVVVSGSYSTLYVNKGKQSDDKMRKNSSRTISRGKLHIRSKKP